MSYIHYAENAPVFLIPAYEPDTVLIELVRKLIDTGHFHYGLIVNDGSGCAFDGIFKILAQMAGVTVLNHPDNLGKGAALKSGFDYIRSRFPYCVGIVTADADGQHALADILAIAYALKSNPGKLIMGIREFHHNVPFRNRMGNIITSKILHKLTGKEVKDTQTGLRGIPMVSINWMLNVPLNGYDFEMEILMKCLKKRIPFIEVAIETIYLNNNLSSHFNPALDSIRIYAVILRHALRSLLNRIPFTKNKKTYIHNIRYEHTTSIPEAPHYQK